MLLAGILQKEVIIIHKEDIRLEILDRNIVQIQRNIQHKQKTGQKQP